MCMGMCMRTGTRPHKRAARRNLWRPPRCALGLLYVGFKKP